MRRFPSVLAVVAGVALATSACGGGGSTTASPADTAAPTETETEAADPEATETGPPVRGTADLVIWTDDLKADAVRTVADTFAEDNGITVEVQVVSADLQPNFVTANNASNGPDVLVGAHDWIGNLVQNGSIDPLQLTAEQLGGYGDTAVTATTYDGQLYGLPYGVEALALYRNADVVPDEPATLDAAIEAGQAAVEAGEVASAFNLQQGELGDAYHMEPVYTSMGGYLFGRTADGGYDAGDLGVGEAGSLAAAEKIAELAGDGVLSTSVSGDNSIALFAAGDAAFLVSGPWALPDITDAGINYEIQPLPGFEGAEPARPFAGVQAFFVASNGQNKAFAQEFVSSGANNEEAMTALYEGTGLAPAMTAVTEGAAADDADAQLFATAAEAGDPMPSIPQMSAVWEPLGQAYAAIIGGADPESTMTTAGETIQSSLE